MTLKLFIDENDVKEVNGHRVKRFYIDPKSLPQDHHFLKQLEVQRSYVQLVFIKVKSYIWLKKTASNIWFQCQNNT